MAQLLLIPDPRPLVERLGHDFFRQLPERPGVYLMQDALEVVLYVGKAKNLRQRLGHYRVANPDRMGRRHLRLLRQVVRIDLLECTDEAAALAKEAELLRILKPKFNRAGVWAGSARFLVWRCAGQALEMAVTPNPTPGWQVFGPFGSGLVYLRASLLRLIWQALNPHSGSATLPSGWLHGQLGAVATMPANQEEVAPALTKLFEGDTEGFVDWINERTKDLVRAYDLEMREADLETVTSFMRAKARRTLPFVPAEESAVQRRPDSPWLFTSEDGIQS